MGIITHVSKVYEFDFGIKFIAQEHVGIARDLAVFFIEIDQGVPRERFGSGLHPAKPSIWQCN
jgi:hypothetical protein